MPAVTLKAHFNGKQIVLDEPFDLPVNSALVVTVLPMEENDAGNGWQDFALGTLARAYGDNEPDYSVDDLKAKGCLAGRQTRRARRTRSREIH
jgi:hypothetical protein